MPFVSVFTTCRFSLSDPHAGMRRSKRSTATSMVPPGPDEIGSELPGDLSDLVRLDHVALLHVLEVLDPDPALVPLGDLPHVVLEPPERADPAVVHDHAVADDAGARVANDRPVDDH